MADQPSYHPLEPAAFFADGRSSRPLVEGTVARGHLRTDIHLYTGRRTTGLQKDVEQKPQGDGDGGKKNPRQEVLEAFERTGFVDTFPFPVTPEFVELGRQRFMIYCAVCHDSLGTGRGKIVERGYTQPKTYHSDRLRTAPVGYFFALITEGYGSMPSYAEQIAPRERWAIVAYVRALQLSQHFPREELTAEMRVDLQQVEGGGSSP